MKYEAVLATTHFVNRGSYQEKLAKEVLEESVAELNGPFALPMKVNHDPLCVPFGKLTSAWVSRLEDNEWALRARIYEDSDPVSLTLYHHSSGGGKEDMVALTFPDDRRPFSLHQKVDPTTLSVVADRVNFRDTASFESFRNDILQDYEDVSMGEVGRRALVPEPLIEFFVNHFSIWTALQWSAGGWFMSRLEKPCRYIVDETLQEVADGIVNSIRPTIRRIFERFQERPAEDDRKTFVAIHLNASPVVRLYARVGGDDVFPEINLPEIMETLSRYSNFMVNAQEVVLEWTEDGWCFRFALSNEGEVLATQDCFNYSIDVYRRVLEASKERRQDSAHVN